MTRTSPTATYTSHHRGSARGRGAGLGAAAVASTARVFIAFRKGGNNLRVLFQTHG
jgi:hypothetical protein